jgi:TRAP-type C4-dicarboxylate transport system permease small subunit
MSRAHMSAPTASSGGVLNAACVALGSLGAVLFASVAALMIAQAASRAFGLGLVGGDEITGWLSASAAFCALPFAFREGTLIRMELLLARMQPTLRRRAELVTLAIGTAWCVTMAWAMARFVWQNAVYGERSTGLVNIPIWPVQVPAALGLALLTVAMADQLWRVSRGELPLYVVKAEQTLAGDDRHTAGV